MALFICIVPSATVAATVTNSPGTGADNNSNGGTIAWSNPSNVTTCDINNATASSSSKTDLTDYVEATSFGFNVPTGSVIKGISVNLERSASDAGSKYFTDSEVRLVKNGTVSSATNKADTATVWPVTMTAASYGATNDLWLDTWTAVDINSTNFGVVVSAARGGNGGGSASVSMDCITIAVSYDPPQEDFTLTVTSAHGTPEPAGVTTSAWGTVIDAAIVDSPIVNGTTQYVCTGWIATGSLTNGTGTNTSFTITEDTAITWQWQTNYWMNLNTTGN